MLLQQQADCADEDLGDVAGLFATNMRLKSALTELENQHTIALHKVKQSHD